MSYGKVHSTFWTDDKIQSLTDDGRLAALYLLTSPHRNAIGCSRIPAQYIAGDLGWDLKRVNKALDELIGIGFIVRDNASGWTFLRNLIKYDPIRGPKMAVGAYRLLRAVPRSSSIFPTVYATIWNIIEAQLDTLPDKDAYRIEAPSDGDANEYRFPLPSPSPSPSPIHTPSPADAVVSEFSEFYEAYPRKVGKGEALKAFREARKRADLAVLVAGAARYAAEQNGSDPKYIAHPATWLRADRWLDEKPPPAVSDVERAIARLRANGEPGDTH